MKVIIFSQEADNTTTETMQWLKYYGQGVFRINSEDKRFRVVSLKKSAKIDTNYGLCEISKDDVVWFRRPKIPSIVFSNKNKVSIMQDCFIADEKKSALYALYHWIIDNCQFVANPFYSIPDKLHVLKVAQKCGCLIPETIFSTRKADVELMLSKYSELAAKPFTTFISKDKKSFTKSFTTLLQKKNLKKIPEIFGGLIIQNYIEKKYELRSFFFEKKFFTMAIFSQNDNKTKIDFRNYNDEKPNRCIPYNLPKEYSKKLVRLSKLLGLDTGSFDILVDKNDNFYFLEVNPVGQFGMVSYPCNYYIEQKIAQILIKKIIKNE